MQAPTPWPPPPPKCRINKNGTFEFTVKQRELMLSPRVVDCIKEREEFFDFFKGIYSFFKKLLGFKTKVRVEQVEEPEYNNDITNDLADWERAFKLRNADYYAYSKSPTSFSALQIAQIHQKKENNK